MIALAGVGAEVTELRGRAVVPGFVDAHHHLSNATLYRGAVDLTPRSARSVGDILIALRRAAASLPLGAWVVGIGYDDFALAERRPPTRRELDDACPDHPVMAMHFSFHQCVVNSRALEAAGIGRETRDPPAGRIGRGRRGEPNGQLFETAISRVEPLARAGLLQRDTDGFIARLERYQQELFAVGITRVADPTVTRDFESLYRAAHASGRLRLPVVMMPVSERGYLEHPGDRLDDAPTGEGPDELRVGPLKLFFDGGDNCAVCITVAQGARAGLASAVRMLRTRSLAPLRFGLRAHARLGRDLRIHTGVHYYETDASSVAFASRAVERGWALAIHAMGNEGVEQALSTLAAVRARHRDSPPPRIEHAMLASRESFARASRDGITLVVQPSFVTVPAVTDAPPLDPLVVLGFRSMLDAGARVAASSDAPVTTFAPLDGVRSAVERRTASGEALTPEEAVSVREALAMYTREAARACGCLDTTGTIEPGKRADLVILSDDPCRVPVSSLSDVRVEETVLGGATVFRAGATPG
ncbi:MAG: amidohydrolase [Gemmatimonadaceae bacterium]